ncbi:MAG: DUF1848 domain-containing protein [Armatimonadota bacterium]
MRVISTSRRTDIPAFYLPWLLNRLRAGYCHVANPMNGQVSRVPLRPEDCLALVFWTRNPAPLLTQLDFLRAAGYYHYTQVTITGFPRFLEPQAPSVDAAVSAFCQLAEAVESDFVAWRFDPLLLSSHTPADEHLRRFETLARRLEGATRRCIISFADFYGKTTRNLERLAEERGVAWHDPGVEEKRALADALADIAESRGMTLHACCEGEIISERMRRAHCVDPELLRLLRPDSTTRLRALPTRPGCGCAESVDIGAYDTCVHGCAYCYATNNAATARRRYHEHDPEDSLLWRPPALRGVDLRDLEKPEKPTQASLFAE